MNQPCVATRVVLLALLSGSAHAATWGVSNTTDTPVGQACPGFTNCSLREAVTSTEANPGADAILVSAGTYTLTNGQLSVTQDLTVARVGAGAATIDGGGAARAFDVSGAGTDFTLRFMTVRNGIASGTPALGGAIRGAAGTTILIESSTLNANTAQGATFSRGGAIASDGNVTIGTATGSTTGSVLTGNIARVPAGSVGVAQGGAVWVGPAGTLTVNARTVLSSNLAEALDAGNTASGGAIHGQSSVALTQTTVSGNTANGGTAQGGGIAASSSTIALSTLSGNNANSTAAAAEGGGVWIGAGGQVTANFSTFAGNAAQAQGAGNARGGALFAPLMTLGNSTVTTNTVSASGSGNSRGGGIAGSGVFTAHGSIVSGNTQSSGDECEGGTLTSTGYTLLAPTTGCGYVAAIGDIVSGTPNLQALANNGGLTQTVAVFQNSPAYNAIPGAASECTNSITDQRGLARPSHANCEIGSYEGQVASDISVTLTDTVSSVTTGTSTTYTLTILHNGQIPLIGATLVNPTAAGLTKTGVICVLPAGCTAPTIPELEGGYTLPDLPASQPYRLSIIAQVTASGGSTVSSTATVALPQDLIDTTPGNNTAVDTDDVVGTPVTLQSFEVE